MEDKKSKYLAEIHRHVMSVQKSLNRLSSDLVERGRIHDFSKFSEPELSGFSENVDNVPGMVYNSEEYSKKWLEMKPIIDIHHINNRHHPEHWPDGINEMSLLDILEMISDWKAACSRYKDGDLMKSVDINCEKYNVTPQLKQIILNTIRDNFDENTDIHNRN